MRKLAMMMVVTGLCGAVAREARAGVASENIDFLYITPFVGYEVTYLGIAHVAGQGFGTTLQTGHVTADGLAYGATVGFRLGPINLGVLYQGTAVFDPDTTLNLSKLYGEVGLDIRAGRMVGVVHLDFGYAFILSQDGHVTNGLGGKLGFALDVYITKVMSIGPDFHIDAQGNSLPGTYTAAVGGTILFRLGIHI